MSDRFASTRLEFQAWRKARLVGIPTGGAGLLPEHRAWLDDTVRQIRSRQYYWIDIVGYASKLKQRGAKSDAQSLQYNRELSHKRAAEVQFYLESYAPEVSSHVRTFAARGNEDYEAPATNDSPDERAVEVHVSLVVQPPVPPRQVEQAKRLPGGARCAKWQVAAPFGIQASVVPGVVWAANVVVLRCCEGRNATHTYWAPGIGVGLSYAGPALSKIKEKIKEALGSLQYSGMSFTDATAITPFNFNDLEGATCKILSAGVGAGPGYQAAYMYVSGRIWCYNDYGEQIFATREFLRNVSVGGVGLQLGAGGSAVGGPLLKHS